MLSLSSNLAVGIMGYRLMSKIKVNTPAILIGRKWKGRFTSKTVWFDKPTATIDSLSEFY